MRWTKRRRWKSTNETATTLRGVWAVLANGHWGERLLYLLLWQRFVASLNHNVPRNTRKKHKFEYSVVFA